MHDDSTEWPETTQGLGNPTMPSPWATPGAMGVPTEGGAGAAGFGGWPAPPAEQPTPPNPPWRRSTATVAVVAMLLASGAIGGVIGAAVGRRSTSPAASALPPQASSFAVPPTTAPAPAPSPATGGGALDTPAIAAKIDPGVVDITTTLADGSAAGTGMVLTSSGLILTNNHVIADATDIRVQIDGSGPLHAAKIVGYDVTQDVAVLQVENLSGLRTVTTGDSSTVAVNDPIIAIGNALGRSGPPAVSTGTVAGLNQTVTASDNSGGSETLNGMIQIDAPIQPGDSGGPLVNSRGQVIGMDTAASARYRRFSGSNVAFAIPINTALTIARQIEAGQATDNIHIGTRGILGVQVLTPSQTQPGVATTGAPVAVVEPGGPAHAVGLVAGDVIDSADGKTISSVADLRPALDAHHPGDTISLGWVDLAGTHHTANVKLAAGPPA
jgi:S1-C subfamily serine protease